MDGWQTRYVNTFSFRLFSATQMPDPILASRTIVVPLIRSIDRNRTNISSEDPDAWPHDRQKLIDDLWLLALAHMPKLKECEAAINASSTLAGRNLEPWRALLAVANWLAINGVDRLLHRMMALSVAYQQERPNVEAADLTGLVIQAVGFLLGRIRQNEFGTSEVSETSEGYTKRYHLLTATITQAVQAVAQVQEIDIHLDHITSSKVGRILAKMRLTKERQKGTGKYGWSISIKELIRWAERYGLNPAKITGLNIVTQDIALTSQHALTSHKQNTPLEGIL